MIKRIVILQDEQLVVREIERNIQRRRSHPQVAAAAPGDAVGAAAGDAGRLGSRRTMPPAVPIMPAPASPPCRAADGRGR